MRSVIFAISGGLLLWLAIGLLIHYEPFKPKAYVNQGSCLQEIVNASEALAGYRKNSNSLPEDLQWLTTLEKPSPRSHIIALSNMASLQFGAGASNKIVLICDLPLKLSSGGQARYCATLSGQIHVVPIKEAILGSDCPTKSWIAWPPNAVSPMLR
jgi:hypothetical protein